MSGYCKYYKRKKQVSYDNGITWTDTGDIERGDLYETNSKDCGYVGVITRWIYSGTTCNGNDLYNVKVKQESTDGGVSWHLTNPVETMLGELVEKDSSTCIPEERWVETDTYGCHKDGMPLGNYKACGYRYLYDSSGNVSTSYFTVPCGHMAYCIGDKSQTYILSFDEVAIPCGSGWDYTPPNNTFYTIYCSDTIKELYIGECVTYIDGKLICSTNYTGGMCIGKWDDAEELDLLEKVIMADSVETIGGYAFYRQRGLTTLDLSENLRIIGGGAFRECSGLTSVVIGKKIEEIEGYAFEGCASLSSVTIKALTPPTMDAITGWTVFDNTDPNLVIYVPAESVNAYKTASGWSYYADKIQAIS